MSREFAIGTYYHGVLHNWSACSLEEAKMALAQPMNPGWQYRLLPPSAHIPGDYQKYAKQCELLGLDNPFDAVDYPISVAHVAASTNISCAPQSELETRFQCVLLQSSVARGAYVTAKDAGLDEIARLKCVVIQLAATVARLSSRELWRAQNEEAVSRPEFRDGEGITPDGDEARSGCRQ